MSGFHAVEPGADLRARARSLACTHDAVMGGSRPAVRPRALVARSWHRVLALGLDPGGPNGREPLSPAELERLREESPLRAVIGEITSLISSVADASQFLLVVTNAEGTILWRTGAASTRLRADRLGFLDGALWTESAVGTNAIGTAITEAAPVQLFSAEHFEQLQHPWYCTAAPIHDPRTGELLGIVDISGPAMTLHPAIAALIETAVRLAELRLWRRHQENLRRLRDTAAPKLAGITGPLLVVDEHGWIAHSTGIGAGERIAAPTPDRALTVPGLGLCVPEQLAGGWLIRPNGDGAEPTVRLLLDLTGEPVVDVHGRGAPWRTSITTRHAEILLLLHHAGPAGLTAAELSRALYGDDEHVVTARAEMSRLRRVLGAVVRTRPYRTAREVELRVEPGDGTFVRDSTAPGVRR